ncbi:MAG TPA: IS630 family transposase [Acidobacteriaceae bacterium]
MKSWCVGTPSARYVAKMEDVLSVYERPHDPRRPVVCLDEKSKELHTTPHGGLPPQPAQDGEPGRPRRQDYEYARNGTANLFLWVEPLAGRRHVEVTERRTAVDFAQQLRSLSDEHYPEAEAIVLVTDNLNTHTPASLYEAFAPEEARRLAARFEWHYTPEHGSWLNMAEIELSVLARQCLNRRVPDAPTLAQEVTAWEQTRNRAQTTIRWQFTASDARIKLRRLYPQVESKI